MTTRYRREAVSSVTIGGRPLPHRFLTGSRRLIAPQARTFRVGTALACTTGGAAIRASHRMRRASARGPPQHEPQPSVQAQANKDRPRDLLRQVLGLTRGAPARAKMKVSKSSGTPNGRVARSGDNVEAVGYYRAAVPAAVSAGRRFGRSGPSLPAVPPASTSASDPR